ncbi:DMT family transporter [Croceimicrobium sp.]|uniref:DMT family transporter n=1 Tax=Croceimicrobium sp. TaxID=2828340 RepID=UPI003BA8D024
MKKAVGFMLISVLGFSLMNLTVKYLDRLPATELVLFRSIVSLVLSLYFIRRRNLSPWGNQKIYLIGRGLAGVTALSLFFYTLQKLPLGSAITLQYLSPIFTALFGIFILKEKVKWWQWIFFALSFAGIALIKGFDSEISPLLFVLGISSSVFAGLAYNFIRKVKNTDHPLVVVLYFPLIATPVMAIISLFNWVTPIGWEWGLLLLMGVLTQIAQINMTKALQLVEANEITGFKYLGVVFALGFDFFLFGYTYEWPVLIGIVLVISGVLFNLLLKAHLRQRAKKRNAA